MADNTVNGIKPWLVKSKSAVLLLMSYRCSSSCSGCIMYAQRSDDNHKLQQLTTQHSIQPRTIPAETSLTWCRPSIMRDIATLTAHNQTIHFHMTLTWKCMMRNIASMNARDAWPLGNEYLSTETVIMSWAFSAGRWRRTIAFVSATATTSKTNTAQKTSNLLLLRLIYTILCCHYVH